MIAKANDRMYYLNLRVGQVLDRTKHRRFVCCLFFTPPLLGWDMYAQVETEESSMTQRPTPQWMWQVKHQPSNRVIFSNPAQTCMPPLNGSARAYMHAY